METRNVSNCGHIVFNSTQQNSAGIERSLELYQAICLFLGIGALGIILAKSFNFIRKIVYREKENLDTDFDAGGKVSAGLTATTIVSQWTWAATLLQSSAVASKYGLSGSFWYASGATIQILLFAMISIQLKIRAPGAKTFLQVIKARFGTRTHLTFCVFALMTNVIVTAMLMLGGAAVMTNLVKGLSVELATSFVAMVIATYTAIGGLGATFYVSYFNTAIIYVIMLVFLVQVYHTPESENQSIGSVSKLYDYVNCIKAPDGNLGYSYLTVVSDSGLMFGIINIVGNFGTVFVDQSYWQSSVAAKPRQGVWGFLSGGLAWFAIPFTFATTMGLAYNAMSAENGAALLSDDNVDAGLVPAVVAQKLMGQTGEMLILLMILMAVTSTGSAEVIAVTSILVYDIYQYLKPYRLTTDVNSCILCGKSRGRQANPRDKCKCISMTYCANCNTDDEARKASKRALKPEYKCKVHGSYRTYKDYLSTLKNWGLMWVTVSIIPLTLILSAMQVSLGWLYLFMGVLIGSAVIPIALTMSWARLTGPAMMAGSIGGTTIALVTWLTLTALQPGGITDFFTSSGAETTMLVGNLVSIVSGGLITVVLTFVTNRHYTPEMDEEVWENTRDIDNPLSPWTELYARDLNLDGANRLDNRPSLAEVAKAFRSPRIISYVGALSLTFLLVLLWPAVATVAGVMNLEAFAAWVRVSEVWGIVAAIFIVIMPLVNEVADCLRAVRFREQGIGDVASMETDSPASKSGASLAQNGKHTQSFASQKADQQGAGTTHGKTSNATEHTQSRHQLIHEVAPLSHAPETMVQSESAIPDAPVPDDNGSVSSQNPRAPIFD